MTSTDDFLKVAVEAAAEAGKFLRDNLENAGAIVYKGEGHFNPASAADKQAESLIVERITRAFPEHSIVAEERGRTEGSSEYAWLIDPLDGTMNYIHGHRHFSVSVALMHGGEVVLGVIYNPVLDEMFRAAAGGGTFLNDRQVPVSTVGKLGESLFSVSFPYDRQSQDFADSLRCFELLAREGQAVRREGSTALSLCHVACGRFDGFCVTGNEVWDYAAGLLLVREAGGSVTDFQGKPFRIGEGSNKMLATNGRIHGEVLQRFKEEGLG
ncbi:MAG: inositol monophosphatase family protein [Chloroflexota bacterium]